MSIDALDRLEAAVSELVAVDFNALSDDAVLELLRRVETVKRRLAPVDHAAIGQVESRSLPFHHGARTATVLLSNLLRITRSEASARVRAAQDLGQRRTLGGQVVEPRFPLTAAAVADGSISDRHAAVITRCVDQLPDALADEHGDFVEKTLLEQARGCDPRRLDGHARALAYLLDQDGQLADDTHREKTRSFDVQVRPDGSAHLEGNLSAEATAHLLVVLDALTKPSNAGGILDPRTATQRRHDAVLTAVTLLERDDRLPTLRGVKATVVLTMDADAWVTGNGAARTGHGYTISARAAKRWAGHDYRIMLTLLTKTRAVAAYSAKHRIFTEQQRLALLAIHGGCSFPDCDAPPGWCELHHVREHRDGGLTSLTNAAPVCSFDHRHHEDMGWKCVMLDDGLPAWLPPRWIDRDRKPQRNARLQAVRDPRTPCQEGR